ncbi:hypothetical protein N9413_13175 [Paracoccaceae bacterium]|nr:hypothetical protein [Paracoccaceae bacterium]
MSPTLPNDPKIYFPDESALILFYQSAGAQFLRPYEMRGENIHDKLQNDMKFRNSYLEVYSRGMFDYCETISSYMPEECANMMDIGCGLGMVPLILSNKYHNTPNFWMLDKSVDIKDIKRAHGSFHNDGYIFTASLQTTSDFLFLNGIDPALIHLLEVNPSVFNKVPDLDLVLSRNSWGFHYPLSTYIDEVCLKLKETGRAIIDVRKGTGGMEILNDRFSHIKIALDSPKSLRVIASNSPI